MRQQTIVDTWPFHYKEEAHFFSNLVLSTLHLRYTFPFTSFQDMTDGSVSIYLPVGAGLALEPVECPRVNVGQPRAPKLERFKCDFYRGQEHNRGWFQREVIEYVTLGRYFLRDATDPAFVGHWFYNDPSVRQLNIDCKVGFCRAHATKGLLVLVQWTGYHEPSRKQKVTIKNEWDQPITKLELAEALFKCIEQFLSVR